MTTTPTIEDTTAAVDTGGEQDTAPAKPPRRPRSGSRRSSSRSSSTGSSSSTGKDKAPRRPRSPRRPAIGPRIAQLYATVGLGVSMTPAPAAQAVGAALVTNAPACGDAWEQLAKEDPRVAELLDRLLTASAYGALLAAHLPIVLAGLVAAGKVPPALGAALGADVTAPAPAPGPAPEGERPQPADAGGDRLRVVPDGQDTGGHA